MRMATPTSANPANRLLQFDADVPVMCLVLPAAVYPTPRGVSSCKAHPNPPEPTVRRRIWREPCHGSHLPVLGRTVVR